MEGLPPLDKSNEYILFLFQDHGNTYICGAFQGRFIIREGYVFQQATEDVKLKNYSPTTVESLLN